MECFALCEVKYWYRYINKTEPESNAVDWNGQLRMKNGIAVHNAIESAYKANIFTRDFLISNWKLSWSNLCKPICDQQDVDSEEVRNLWEQGARSLDMWWSTTGKLGLHTDRGLVEVMAFDVLQGIPIVGKADLIYDEVLYDWKTGWGVPKEETLAKKFQVILYSHIFEVKKIKYFYLWRNKIVEVDSRDLNPKPTFELLDAMWFALHENRFKPNHKHCKKCEYSSQCKFLLTN